MRFLHGKGFLRGEGFPLLLGENPAELIPHKGLVPVIELTDEYHGFPVEEVNHEVTISRNCSLLALFLREFWMEKKINLRSIQAWIPFVEASSNVYSRLERDMGKDLDNFYSKVFIRRYSSQGSSNSNRNYNGPDGVERKTLVRFIKRIQNSIRKVIKTYVDENLITEDLQKEWIQFFTDEMGNQEKGMKSAAHQFVEKYLPGEVYKEFTRESSIFEPNFQPSFSSPQKWWFETLRVLEEWEREVEKGRSPFPLKNDSLNSTLPQFLDEWNFTIFKTLSVLTEMLSSKKFNRIVQVAPAIHHNINPYILIHWYLAVNDNFLYPLLLLPKEKRDPILVEPFFKDETRPKSVCKGVLKELNCELWEEDVWLNIGDAENYSYDITETDKYIQKILSQITDFLENLEDLWHQANVKCQHCKNLLEKIRSSQSKILSRYLVNRNFSSKGFLIKGEKEYSKWLDKEITQTYKKNPVLNMQ